MDMLVASRYFFLLIESTKRDLVVIKYLLFDVDYDKIEKNLRSSFTDIWSYERFKRVNKLPINCQKQLKIDLRKLYLFYWNQRQKYYGKIKIGL